MQWVHQPWLNTCVYFEPNVKSIRLVSHAPVGRYLINLTTLQDVRLLGVNVTMYVVDDNSIPRHRYLRRVSRDTFLQYGERLYADKEEEEEELMREFVDTTFVSGVCEHIVRSCIDYIFNRGRACNTGLRREGVRS
jgi:hypothetical protein